MSLEIGVIIGLNVVTSENHVTGGDVQMRFCRVVLKKDKLT